ncbi:hypothetical protein J4218_02915 [Candidatus Pacearchaeota archaeon]|nr:hypothetical protein [Candidatus Pacearchaeota archaeon]
MKKIILKKNKKVNKWLFWTPRILAILFVMFISLFALDIFDSNLGFWGTILGLFMHLIPSFLLIIVLLIAWRYNLVGGIIFIGLGVLYFISTAIRLWPQWYIALSWSMIIALPAIIIGVMFILNWMKKRKR